jgi:hypothetical protein
VDEDRHSTDPWFSYGSRTPPEMLLRSPTANETWTLFYKDSIEPVLTAHSYARSNQRSATPRYLQAVSGGEEAGTFIKWHKKQRKNRNIRLYDNIYTMLFTSVSLIINRFATPLQSNKVKAAMIIALQWAATVIGVFLKRKSFHTRVY